MLSKLVTSLLPINYELYTYYVSLYIRQKKITFMKNKRGEMLDNESCD